MSMRFDDFEFDPLRLALTRSGEPVRVDRTTLRLLRVLLEFSGRAVTKTELIERVWDRRVLSANVVSVAIARLRKALGHERGVREYVVSAQGRGYRFVRRVTEGVDAPRTSNPEEACAVAFVGRDAVLARMKRMLTAASAGRGGVVLLTGEAGIGKTAAAEQLAVTARANDVRVAWAHCDETGETPPLWPFAQLVRRLLPSTPGQVIDVPALRALVPELAPTAREDVRPATKHELFEAVLAVLEYGSALLIIDDLHRADAASLELLRYWMNRVAHSRVMLLATLRSLSSAHALTAVDLTFVVGHASCVRLPLQRLDRAAVHAYVGSVLRSVDPTLSQAVWSRSEGNPFFMVELTRQLTDTPHAHAEALRVSREALQLLAPRIAELDAAAHGLLSTAAVIGRRFELPLLEQLAGCDRPTILACLERALTSETLVRAADADTAFAFSHELMRKILYDALTPARRRRLHLDIGLALQARAARGEAVPSMTLAHHFHAALPESDASTTLEHCQRAALDAMMMFAFADGIRHIEHALEALGMFAQPDPARRLVLLFQKAILARLICAPGFAEVIDEAADAARALRSGVHLIEFGLLLHLHPGFPTLPRSRGLLEEGLAMLGEQEPAVRGAALARLAVCGPIAFDGARSGAQLERALALTGVDAQLRSYNAYAAAQYFRGGLPRGATSEQIDDTLARIAQARPHGMPVGQVVGELHAAMISHQAGRIEETNGALARLRRRCREMGLREFGWYAERYQLMARLQHTGVESIAPELDALHARARRESILGSELMCAFDLAVVLKAPLDEERWGGVLAYAVDDPPSVWSVKAHARAAAGHLHDAAHLLHAVSAHDLAALPQDRDWLGTLGALTRAALATDAKAHMAVLYRLLTPHAERLAVHMSFLCLGPVALLLGELASALDERADALAHFTIASEVAKRKGLDTHLAVAQAAIDALSR